MYDFTQTFLPTFFQNFISYFTSFFPKFDSHYTNFHKVGDDGQFLHNAKTLRYQGMSSVTFPLAILHLNALYALFHGPIFVFLIL